MLSLAQDLGLLLTGLGAGVLGGLLGLGGGLIMVPAQVLLLGIPVRQAVAASLTAVVATSSSAAGLYLERRRVHLSLALFLESTTTLGAILGGILGGILSEGVVRGIFALVLAYTAARMVWRVFRKNGGSREGEDALPALSRLRMAAGMLLAAVAGMASGLLGIGGGVIKVPLMREVLELPMKRAVATSSYMVGITAVAGAAVYLARGDLRLEVAVPLVVGVTLGGRLGALWSRRVSGRTLEILFALVLLYTALRMAGLL